MKRKRLIEMREFYENKAAKENLLWKRKGAMKDEMLQANPSYPIYNEMLSFFLILFFDQNILTFLYIKILFD